MAILSRVRAFLRRENDGAASIEFVIIFPVLMVVVLSAIESGFLMTRYMMLDRGVDVTVRNLRTGDVKDSGGNPVDPDHAWIRDSICDAARILPNCKTTLIVELVTEADAASSFPNNDAECLDRTGTVAPVLNVSDKGGKPSEVMYIRACALVDPFMPGVGLGLLLPKDQTGAHRMVSYTAFMNEPI